MCGRFHFPTESDSDVLQRILSSLESRQILVKTGDVFPGDTAAVVARNRHLDTQAFGMHWGYHLPNGKLVFNTRSETASEKQLFSDGMHQRRCLIPAACYYEWQKHPDGKQKYAISSQGTDVFFLAGIYRIEASTPVFSVLTQEPRPEIAFIHNRMPVIIPEAIMQDWLNPRYNPNEVIATISNAVAYYPC